MIDYEKQNKNKREVGSNQNKSVKSKSNWERKR